MIDISKGRFWDMPLSLVDGCTPCSPGCDHCWSAGMKKRFEYHDIFVARQFTNPEGQFNGNVVTHPERLSIPLKRKKPTVYAVWNDLFHEAVPDKFIGRAFSEMIGLPRHIFLVLSKRPERMADLMSRFYAECDEKSLRRAINVYHGLTICNQREADEKIPVFLQVPGKKFLSIEPCLSQINLTPCGLGHPQRKPLDLILLGGETGPGARPMHPDWVRSVRDQCATAGVPFFFKQWGEFILWEEMPDHLADERKHIRVKGGEKYRSIGGSARVGRKNAGRLLDGRTHDELPWKQPAKG